MSVDIVVVGGGVAGLSAAATLTQAGLRVILLEARDRVGGRVFSLQHGGVLELGAQWLHGGCPANCMYNLAVRHNLLGEKVKVLGHDWERDKMPGYFYTSSGRVIKEEVSDTAWDIFEEINNESQDYFSNINHETIDTSVSLKQFYWELVREKIDNLGTLKPSEEEDLELCLTALSTALAEYACDDLERPSVALFGSSRELPGGDVIVPDGLKNIIDTIADTLPPEVIKLGEKVNNIDWSVDKLIITTDSSMFFCDQAIVTVPLGVLKKKHKELFTPSLGKDKITALSAMGEGSISKIFIEWDQPWWMDGHAGVQLAWSKTEMETAELPEHWYRSIFNFSQVEGQQNVLMFWVVGQAATVADSLPDLKIVDTVTWLLRTFTGDLTLPAPDRVIRHCWTTDPYTMGGYSYPSTRSQLSDHAKLAEPLPSCHQPKLLLAGEHTHANYWSFLHGARMSGIEQAQKIVNWRRRQGEQEDP
eukprot:GFUD01009774.1.p1 GENE.GFUD01009774.1~~GFUD01009774.1.p1  ORF type:complete len:509 (+),score=156.59 GFUD01009774.1:101-1528(+)